MKITKAKLKEIIKEEIIKEAGPAGMGTGGEMGGWSRDPESGFEEKEEIIGGDPIGSARELAARLNDAILYLRAKEEREPEAATYAAELLRVQQELDRQAGEEHEIEHHPAGSVEEQ